MSDPAPIAESLPGAPAPSPPTQADVDALLTAVIAKAIAYGAARERARVASIMSLPVAKANPTLAWRLAVAGEVSREAAEQAWTLDFVAGLPAAIGESGRVLEN
jgi:hypothetical protein